MITENELHEYNKWLMTVWNPNQLYIPFAVDAPKAYLDHIRKVKNISSNTISGRFKVRISEILKITERRNEINNRELGDIDFLDENDNPIKADKKIIDDFKFCGLSNIDFITSEFYKSGFETLRTHKA